jgi:hypothetical protein
LRDGILAFFLVVMFILAGIDGRKVKTAARKSIKCVKERFPGSQVRLTKSNEEI